MTKQALLTGITGQDGAPSATGAARAIMCAPCG